MAQGQNSDGGNDVRGNSPPVNLFLTRAGRPASEERNPREPRANLPPHMIVDSAAGQRKPALDIAALKRDIANQDQDRRPASAGS
jgi:hypothetical protein